MKVVILSLVSSLFVIGFSCESGTSPANVVIPQRDTTFTKVVKSDEEWRKSLTPEQYYVLRKSGTERAGSGQYDKFYKTGTYDCIACAFPIFTSKSKFDSGTGWPSFYEPANDYCLTYIDQSHGSSFVKEVRCARCDGHLGHVFNDGPQPTGLRYCINSVCLKFNPK